MGITSLSAEKPLSPESPTSHVSILSPLLYCVVALGKVTHVTDSLAIECCCCVEPALQYVHNRFHCADCAYMCDPLDV